MRANRRLSFAAAISLLAGAAPAQEYTVEGTLIHTRFSYPDQKPTRFQEHFKIRVSNAHWSVLEVSDHNDKPLRKETGFDGTNLFQLHTFPPAPSSRANGRKTITYLEGFIHSPEMPAPGMLFNTTLLWLAYASGGHYLNAEPGKARPVWMLDQQGLWQTGFRVPATWTHHPAPPFLPERVAYYDEGRTHPQDGSMPVVLNPGFTNVFYSASFTNVGEIAVPSTFSLVRLKVSNGGPTNAGELYLASTDEAVVEKIALSCEPRSFRPAISGPAHVTDCRLQSNPWLAPRYVVTNGDWSIMPYSALVAYREKQREQENALAKAKSKRRSAVKPMVTLLAMALVTGVFIPFLRRAARE